MMVYPPTHAAVELVGNLAHAAAAEAEDAVKDKGDGRYYVRDDDLFRIAAVLAAVAADLRSGHEPGPALAAAFADEWSRRTEADFRAAVGRDDG